MIQKGVGDSFLITHLLCAKAMTLQGLDLWSNKNCCHGLVRFLDFSITGAEEYQIIVGFLALETSVEIFVGACECHTRVDTHVVMNRDDPSEIFDMMLDLIIGKESPFCLWVAPEKSSMKIMVCFL